jgi:hypothetical protein
VPPGAPLLAFTCTLSDRPFGCVHSRPKGRGCVPRTPLSCTATSTALQDALLPILSLCKEPLWGGADELLSPLEREIRMEENCLTISLPAPLVSRKSSCSESACSYLPELPKRQLFITFLQLPSRGAPEPPPSRECAERRVCVSLLCSGRVSAQAEGGADHKPGDWALVLGSVGLRGEQMARVGVVHACSIECGRRHKNPMSFVQFHDHTWLFQQNHLISWRMVRLVR